MLAPWLTTVAWVCFAVSVIGQAIWAMTVGRHANMPYQLYDSMIAAIGTVILGQVVILLDIYSPDRLVAFGVLMLIVLAFASFRGEHLKRPDQPTYPMTAAWAAAARRSAQLSALFVASVGAVILVARPESAVICAIGTVAAMNLRAFAVSFREDRLDALSRIWLAIPFILTFAMWYASRDGGILKEGLNISYADLSLQVRAAIPGNDAATVQLLRNYVCFMLLFYLLTLVAEVVNPGKGLADTKFVLLKFLRGGITLIALLFLLPDPPTASALLVEYLLFVVEFAVLMAPAPDAHVRAAPAERQDASNPA